MCPSFPDILVRVLTLILSRHAILTQEREMGETCNQAFDTYYGEKSAARSHLPAGPLEPAARDLRSVVGECRVQ
jgi:hypothetical protein